MISHDPYRIRLATQGDLEAILLLDRAIENLPHWAAADYRAALSDPGEEAKRCLFVAEAQGQLAGLAVGMFHAIAGEISAELETIGVALAMQRHGLGRQLCLAVIDWCRSHGALHVDLEVRSGSLGPIALYSSLGFAAIGNRPNYYRDPADDALLMRLNLNFGQTDSAQSAPK